MITVVGSLNLDLVVSVARLPAPGETILARDYAEHAGGKGANQAVAAARAGGRVAMVGRVGADAAGEGLRAGLEADGVDVTDVLVADAPSGRALIEVDDHGENRIVVVPGANGAWSAADLPEERLAATDVLLVQREVPDDVVAGAVRRVHDAGGRAMLNLAPAGRVDADLLAALSVLLVNESEAALLHGGMNAAAVGEAPLDAARELATRVRGDVVITLGAAGAAHAGPAGEGRVPGLPVAVVDTTAAGDAFAGALAARLDAGAALPDAMRFACVAGALAVTRPGARPSLPHRDAVEARLGDAR